MGSYKHTISKGKTGINTYKLSYILFGAFLLTASMNRTSIYQNFTVPDLFLSLSFFIVVTGFLINGFFPANFLIHENPVWAPGLLFIFSCLVAILVGPKSDFLNSILVLAQFIFIFFVMSPIFRFHFQKRPGKAIHYVEGIGVLILISGLFACFVAILQEYTGVSILSANVTKIGRHGSYMQGPGNFSHYLTLVWTFGLHFALVGRRGKRLLGIFSLPILVIGVFLSAARFAFIAIPLVSCLYLGCRALYTREGWRKFLYGFVITLVVSAIAWSIFIFIQNPDSLRLLISSISISSGMEKKLLSFYKALKVGSLVSFDPMRVFVTSKALDFLRSFPLLGIGLDNARYVLGFRVHILLLTVWIEGGMLALISVMIIYWKVLKSGIKTLRNYKSYRDISLVSALFAGCAASFLCGFQSPLSLQNRYEWIPYFMMLIFSRFADKRRGLKDQRKLGKVNETSKSFTFGQ